MAFLAWVTLLAPLIAAITLLVRPRLRGSSGGPKLAIFSVFICAATSLVFWLFRSETVTTSFEWMTVGDLTISIGLLVDNLSTLMLLVVGLVGSAIFVFARGYMKGDPSIGRFYAKFALFVFSMLGIVLADNFLMMFIFWELVGASSYLLIGYYFEKPSACDAAKKAFLTNRVADFGFLLGILMIWSLTGSFEFAKIADAVKDGDVSGPQWQLTLAGILIFVGAMGKSAQVPFHVWLPDAMEGPTPVSALMHAATMVAAGVFMIIRAFSCFDLGVGATALGGASMFIATTGGVTAFLAATIALVQRDIKKVLAYSTLSQLGYMVMALGAGAYSIAMFHLTTHAFFKGLLFLCAGSVIHGCHHEQDMFKMGGLRKKMPATFWCFTIGMFALMGLAPLAGFFSKDLIIDSLHQKHLVGLQIGATVTAALTALYMTRAWLLTFFGEYRGHATPHESPPVMTRPLKFLAFVSAVIGLVFYYGHGQDYLSAWHGKFAGPLHMDPTIAVVSTVAGVVGFLIALALYKKSHRGGEKIVARFPRLHSLLVEKYYIDDSYHWLVQNVQQVIARGCRWFEEAIVVGVLVGWPVGVTRWTGDRLRRMQSGRLAFYASCFVGGVTILILFLYTVAH